MTDARYLLQRALVILWTEIRWRPAGDDAEKATIDEALTLLRKALPERRVARLPVARVGRADHAARASRTRSRSGCFRQAEKVGPGAAGSSGTGGGR